MLVPKYPVEPAAYGEVTNTTVPSETPSLAPGELVPIPTFWLVSTVIAVVPADCNVNAVADAEDNELIVGVVRVGLVPNTLAPLPVLVVTPVPPLATARVPVTGDTGTPVVPSIIIVIV